MTKILDNANVGQSNNSQEVEVNDNNVVIINGVSYFSSNPTTKPKKETIKRFGVINSIAFVLLTTDKPMTKKQILDKVLELNPDKSQADKKSISQTINVQVPSRLKKERFAVLTLFNKEGERLYIADMANKEAKEELIKLKALKAELEAKKEAK